LQVTPISPFSTSDGKRAETSQAPHEKRMEMRRKEQVDADARALERNFTREWKAGDVYAPHDLSAAEARKWKRKQTPNIDAFDALSLNPLDCYKVIFHIWVSSCC
jgi:small subunit ribosomal protein S18